MCVWEGSVVHAAWLWKITAGGQNSCSASFNGDDKIHAVTWHPAVSRCAHITTCLAVILHTCDIWKGLLLPVVESIDVTAAITLLLPSTTNWRHVASIPALKESLVWFPLCVFAGNIFYRHFPLELRPTSFLSLARIWQIRTWKRISVCIENFDPNSIWISFTRTENKEENVDLIWVRFESLILHLWSNKLPCFGVGLRTTCGLHIFTYPFHTCTTIEKSWSPMMLRCKPASTPGGQCQPQCRKGMCFCSSCLDSQELVS